MPQKLKRRNKGQSNQTYSKKVTKVNRKAMIRNKYNQILRPTLKTKHTQIHKHSHMTCTVNQMNSSFPNRYSVTLIENNSNMYFYLFSILNYKNRNKTESIIGSCHSCDHIAEDHIHADITTCNIEEPRHR